MNYRRFLADTTRRCSIVAHRGIWRDAPENSLLAIERAIHAGFDVVEIDVRRTADGDLVLLHDDTLERTTGAAGRPEEMTSAALVRLALRNRDGGSQNGVTDQTLPRLAEVFALTRDRIFIHLDIKDRDVISETLALAQKMGVDQQVDFWADLKHEDDVRWVEQTILSQDVAFIARTRLEQESGPTQLDLTFGLKRMSASSPSRRSIRSPRSPNRFAAAGIALWVNTLDSVASPGFTDAAALRDPAAVWGGCCRPDSRPSRPTKRRTCGASSSNPGDCRLSRSFLLSGDNHSWRGRNMDIFINILIWIHILAFIAGGSNFCCRADCRRTSRDRGSRDARGYFSLMDRMSTVGKVSMVLLLVTGPLILWLRYGGIGGRALGSGS